MVCNLLHPSSPSLCSPFYVGVAIHVENGTFKRNREDLEPTLKGINFRIKSGELVAVVGPVGCGKVRGERRKRGSWRKLVVCIHLILQVFIAISFTRRGSPNKWHCEDGAKCVICATTSMDAKYFIEVSFFPLFPKFYSAISCLITC